MPTYVRLTSSTERPILRQDFQAFKLHVPAAPASVPMSSGNSQSSVDLLVDAFQVVVPFSAANSVWFAKQNVTVGAGMEARPGIPLEWSIRQERQLYELQRPLNRMQCSEYEEEIPFVVWDCSQIYFTATNAVDIAIIQFFAVFI